MQRKPLAFNPKKSNSPELPIIPLLLGIVGLLILFFGAQWVLSNWGFSSFSSTDTRIENCRDVNRSTYGIIPEVFDSLPPIPKCFHSAVEAYYSNRLTDDFFFSDAYYLQPEFYPDFLTGGKNQWTAPAGRHWGIVGYGAYPLQRELIMHPGETKKIRLFVHAGFGVRSFQGMGLRVQYRHPNTEKALTAKLSQDATNGFLLGPTFPKFHPAWAHPVEIELSVSADSPTQDLEMTFYSTPPSSQQKELFVQEVQGYYSNATAYLGERPVAVLRVQIR